MQIYFFSVATEELKYNIKQLLFYMLPCQVQVMSSLWCKSTGPNPDINTAWCHIYSETWCN